MSGVEARETAGITTRLIVAFVRSQLGEDGVAELLARAGETRPAAVLEDERTWSTYEQKIALFEVAATLTGDPRVARRIGAAVLDAKLGPSQQLVIGALGSPRQVLRSIARANGKFSTSATMWAEETSANHGVVGYRLHAGHEPSSHDCDYNQGLLSQVTALFGLPSARVTHPTCQVTGADACYYELQWPAWRRWSPRVRRRARRRSDDALQVQVGELEQAVADLVGVDDLDDVLARIASRAGLAVRAQRHLLAVRLDDGSVALHADGFTASEAEQLGRQLLTGATPVLDGSTVLTSRVVSSRRSYGALAASLPAGAGFLPAEQEHLDAYAGLVAAALDVSAALQAERRTVRVNQTLLHLSRRLAEVEGEERIAAEVVAAVPVVTGTDRASVLRWDPVSQRLDTLALIGFGDASEERARWSLPVEDSPLLRAMVDAPRPLDLKAGEIDDAHVAEVLERFGTARAHVVPMLADGSLLGLLVAAVVHGDGTPGSGGPTAEGLRATDVPGALASLADQAAVAIARGRLLAAALHAASHDQLTGLPGRELFTDRLERVLADHRRSGRRAALCFIDLDGFKAVNDRFGHAAGDAVLVNVSERMLASIRESDTAARLSGDEFVLLLRDLEDDRGVERAVTAVVDRLSEPVVHDGQPITVTVSIGVALVPDHGDEATGLLRAADEAMYVAKGAGGGTIHVGPPAA